MFTPSFIAGTYAASVLLTYVLLYYNQQFKLKKGQLELAAIEDKIILLKETIEMPTAKAASDAEFLQIYSQGEKVKLQNLMKRSEELTVEIQPLQSKPVYLFVFSLFSPILLPSMIIHRIGKGANYLIKYFAEVRAKQLLGE